MQLADLIMAAAAGVLATYVHFMFALWAPRYGLPRLDFAKMLADLSFAESFDGPPPYWLGLLALHLNGIVFALLYATVFGALLPGPGLVRGLIFGGILLIGSQCLFVPVILQEGFFGLKGNPRERVH
jgi:hypothetical protein